KIVGSVHYQVREPIEGESMLRLSWYRDKFRYSTFAHPRKGRLAGRGSIAFTFPPVDTCQGPLLVFLELSSLHGKREIIESNAVAALVRVTGDEEGTRPGGEHEVK